MKKLETFYDEIFSYLLLAEQGSNPSQDRARRLKRMEYFCFYLNMVTLKIVLKARSEHYRLRSWYEYNSERNIIMIRETFGHLTDDCLCDNVWERSSLSFPLTIPDIPFPNITHQIIVNNNEGFITKISEYHIIPLSLINRFFSSLVQ